MKRAQKCVEMLTLEDLGQSCGLIVRENEDVLVDEAGRSHEFG